MRVAYQVFLLYGMGQLKEVTKRIAWFLREESPVDECSLPVFICLMYIIIWNCKGALKPSFQNHVRELVQDHNLTILVVMETRLGGERAREITDRLPFDGAVHTDTIEYAGGLWVLWNSDRVEVS